MFPVSWSRIEILLVISIHLLIPTESHVALIFPPARQYALDFLDNVRTPTPCGGMPKGSPSVNLIAGKTYTFSWSLGYPHQGSFKIELLDSSGATMYTFGSLVSKNNATNIDNTQTSAEVTIPSSSSSCLACVIRLVRQALEWGSAYQFQSCADVNIYPDGGSQGCMNGGSEAAGKCTCLSMFSGDMCQYKDECLTDQHCNNHGKCIDTGAFTYPKKQCYCEMGWFGTHCKNESAVKTKDDILKQMSELNTKKQLTDGIVMYYRFLKDTSEIQVIVENDYNSWLGLGWRPTDTKATCRAFPLSNADPKAEGKPEPEVTPEPEAKPEPESEPEPTSEPHHGSKPEPTGEPEGTGKPEPEVEPEAEPEGDHHGDDHAHAGNLHGMDCTDMVIMALAEDKYTRILDYYSRDRSTPQPDSFYGGQDDITAAAGYREDGKSRILFRKRAKATHSTDHTIENTNLLFIWARGQEKGSYCHSPNSGLEDGLKNSVTDFYKKNELKYHGICGKSSTTLNFYKGIQVTSEKSQTESDSSGSSPQTGSPKFSYFIILGLSIMLTIEKSCVCFFKLREQLALNKQVKNI